MLTENLDRVLETPHTYAELLSALEPEVIKNEEQYQHFSKAAEVLMAAVHKRPEDLNLRKIMDLIVRLVDDFEEEHHPYEPELTPVETIKQLLQNQGITQAELAGLLGVQRSAVNNVLTGGRPVPTSWARTLAAKFNYPIEWFLEK